MNIASKVEAADEETRSSSIGYFRPARSLIAWLPPEAAHSLLVSGPDLRRVSQDIVTRARSARDFAAARKPLSQTEVVQPPPPDIGTHLAALRQNAQALFDDGFRVATADLAHLYAIQANTFTDQYGSAVKMLDESNMLEVAQLTLPLATEVQLSIGVDATQKSVTVTCANPNLQLLGPLQPQTGPNGCVVGFQTTVSNSFLQVGVFDGRYFCRDGHTRALQLLKRGITHAPVLVKQFASYAEVAPRPNLLPDVIALGSNAPMLQDFLDDRVSADVLLPTTRKAIVITATEVEIPV
jgi:hypothetical protein